MNAGELYEWLGENTYPEQEIRLQVGGEAGELKSIVKNGLNAPVVLSAERSMMEIPVSDAHDTTAPDCLVSDQDPRQIGASCDTCAPPMTSSGEHLKVFHNGSEVCDTCINVLGLNVRWDPAHPDADRDRAACIKTLVRVEALVPEWERLICEQSCAHRTCVAWAEAMIDLATALRTPDAEPKGPKCETCSDAGGFEWMTEMGIGAMPEDGELVPCPDCTPATKGGA